MKKNIIFTPRKTVYAPLETIKIKGVKNLSLCLSDGDGKQYYKNENISSDSLSLQLGSVAGRQKIFIFERDRLIEEFSFMLEAETKIFDSKKNYSKLLQNLFLTMCNSCGGDGSQFVEVNGKIYNYFICWLRDHTHTLKGMKYFYPHIKKGLELYADTQRVDGMLFERIARKKMDVQGWRDYTFKDGGFIKTLYSNNDKSGKAYTLQRIPVENDVEYLFIECLYYTWKASGDTDWMNKYLDNCIKAVKYATNNKYRWSKKYGLLKRAYTIDTWDFIHKDDAKFTLGDNCFDKDKTVFGVMFGDNTGMAISCKYLAEMLRAVGRAKDASKYEKIAEKLYKNLEKVSWNGEFYTHHVSEDPSFKRDLGNTDENKQVTLSNAYSINRDIGYDKASAIIETYKRIRKEMPKNSPGEFYNCYPPFEKGFGAQNEIWQYMNGGVSTIVAGELARGAFNLGEEKYGVDILERIAKLAEKYDGHLHVCFNGNPQKTPPKRKFRTVEIANFANITTKYRENGGWGDEGNDLSHMPIGRKKFFGIPFVLGRKGIGLSWQKNGYKREQRIKLNCKLASLYMLHTCSGNGNPVAEIEIIYKDQTSSFINIEKGNNIDSWFMPDSGETRSECHSPKLRNGWAEYQVAWRGSSGKFDNVASFIWGFNNPHPEKEVSEIVFRVSKNQVSYLILSITLCDTPVWFPQSELSYGIPDAWGAAAVVYALVEGLCGVIDKSLAFETVEISPRWTFTDEKKAEVTIKYEASGAYTAYAWEKTSAHTKLIFTSSGENIIVKIPVGDNRKLNILLDGEDVNYSLSKIKNTNYAVIKTNGSKIHILTIT